MRTSWLQEKKKKTKKEEEEFQTQQIHLFIKNLRTIKNV